MRSTINIVLLAIMLLVLVPAKGVAQFYYSDSREMPLGVDSNKVLVKFTSPLQQHTGNWVDMIGRISEWQSDDDHVIDGFIAFSLSSSIDYYDFLDSLDTLPNVELVEPYYTGYQDSALLVGDQFVVAFTDDITQAQIDSINTHYGVLLDHSVEYMDNVFALRNTKQSGIRTLEMSNLFYNLDETTFSHPLFSLRPVLHSYEILDEYAEFQPHLKKVIGSFNDRSVWDFAKLDKPIVVAVIDDGVTIHEDLPAERILTGYDFADHDSDPSPSDDIDALMAHGMSVTGIISASHKTDRKTDPPDSMTGVFSIAPETMIKPVKIWGNVSGPASPEEIASAISYAWKSGADVINCSWGFNGYRDQTWDLISVAIGNAYHCGRGDDTLCSGEPLGCPIIFSAGNYGIDWVSFPSNLDWTIAVGATQLDDNRWGYSQYSSKLDLVAPSSGHLLCTADLWTVDQMGDLGFNPFAQSVWGCADSVFWDCGWQNDVNYNCKFGGTSAAAPIVSGTAALILSYNDTLEVETVYDILKQSAVTELESGTITPPDLEYGYGRVDAFRAILSLARGDMNSDGKYNLADITILSDYIYISGPGGFPDVRLGNCDCSSDGSINLADVTLLIDHVYISKAPLPLPCFVY